MQGLSPRLLSQVTFFSAVGAIIGYIEFLAQVAFFSPPNGAPRLEFAPLLLVAPCLATTAALPIWGFKLAETYWKAPLLCAIALISWTILRSNLLAFLFDDLAFLFDDLNPVWHAVELWLDGVVRVFAMFAFIIRAMVVRAGGRVALNFVVLSAAFNLIYLSADSLPTWVEPVVQYSLLLGALALAVHALPRKKARPPLETVVE
jgi:hypothetical protein